MDVFCSTIIPTIGRETVSTAVQSVLMQELEGDTFEVIVVNDSGKSLFDADWQHSEKVHIINTNRRERSVARNAGAAIAKGRYLHFLDDDDWLAPGAFQHLRSLSQNSQAKWLYGITQLVDRKFKPIIRLQHNLEGNCCIQCMAGEWIPLQSSIIDARTFFEVGGFNPLLAGPEDTDLLRRISAIEELAETPNLVAYIARGEQGSTTDYHSHPEARRWAREHILNTDNIYRVMRASANTTFWRGCIARIYLTSALWNLRDGRLVTAVSRILFGLLSVMNAGFGIFSKEFWSAVIRPYESVTFRRGFQEVALAN